MVRTIQKYIPELAPEKFYSLSLERNGDHALMLVMTPLPYDPKNDKFYTSAAWHKRFVSEGCVIYATCDEQPAPLSNETIVSMLKDWRAGRWKTISTKKSKTAK